MPHPLEQTEIEIATVLRGDLARSLIEIAERRGQPPVEMVADLITVAIKDDMFDAVIDDGR